MSQKLIPNMTGYKATDENMVCSPNGNRFQFVLDKWYECEGDLELCKNGFHFCEEKSGPLSYYTNYNTRLWKIEAQDVLDTPLAPGADNKHVCRKIKFVEEIFFTEGNNTGKLNIGNDNTGSSNVGDCNTGKWNTGSINAGNKNVGNKNTGYSNNGDNNTGYYNFGSFNAGTRNYGDDNTGNHNCGDSNTGNHNYGDYNTGNHNAGNCNTGEGNATNNSTGFFCVEEPKVMCFDVNTGLTQEEFMSKYPKYVHLTHLLRYPTPINFNEWSDLPGITPEKLLKLHQTFLEKMNEKISNTNK